MNFKQAVKEAKRLAADGPRVAAILKDPTRNYFSAVPGYIDADGVNVQQVALVTPDGRVWKPE